MMSIRYKKRISKLIRFCVCTSLILFSSSMLAQKKFVKSIDISCHNFQFRTIQYDVSENGQGYNLRNKENAVEASFSYALKLKERFQMGLGLGYINYESINGLTAFSGFKLFALKRKISPFAALRIGYNHIWNQYQGGSGTGLIEFGAGISYKLIEKLNISIASGVIFTQEAQFVPIKLTLSF